MNKLELMLVRDEGKRLTIYDDATGKELKKGDTIQGNPTLGIGHNLNVPISEAACDQIFQDDQIAALQELHKYPWFSMLDDVRQDALTNMMFNLGANKFADFHNMIQAFENHDYEEAAKECLDSEAARQLPERYNEIAYMIRTGEYQN